MKNIIKENKLMIAWIIGYIALIIFALNIKAENNQKDKELADEKYQKNLVTALYEKRDDYLWDTKEIDIMIENLLQSKQDKLQDITEIEHIIRCEKANTFRSKQDDCISNWENYPL